MTNIAIYLIIMLFAASIYAVIVEQNLFKRLFFVSIMQSSIIIYYILNTWYPSISTPFYIDTNIMNYIDPVPQALMLTAIVVGFSTTALCISMIIRIKKKTGTIMRNEIFDDENAKF